MYGLLQGGKDEYMNVKSNHDDIYSDRLKVFYDTSVNRESKRKICFSIKCLSLHDTSSYYYKVITNCILHPFDIAPMPHKLTKQCIRLRGSIITSHCGVIQAITLILQLKYISET